MNYFVGTDNKGITVYLAIDSIDCEGIKELYPELTWVKCNRFIYWLHDIGLRGLAQFFMRRGK